MKSMVTRTYQPKAAEVKRDWHHLDAEGKVLGRFATQIAAFLQGKNKPVFSKHMDMGDYVVVTNVEKVRLTGKKEDQKIYYKHSGYLGNLKGIPVAQMRREKPTAIIEHAVSGMLPKNRLKSQRMRRLKLVVGDKNPYESRFSKNVKKTESKK